MGTSPVPFISVVVPAYNAQSMIALCIESLLGQTYPKDRYEVLIVDNNSTDDTAEIIKKYPVTYLLESNKQTPYAARNTGIRHARGSIIALTDSDCVADENWLKQGAAPFDDPKVIAVGGRITAYEPRRYIEFYQEKNKIFNQKETLSKQRCDAKSAAIATPNAFYRKEALEKVGLFDDTIFGGGDYEICYRIQKSLPGRFIYAEDAVIYHKHASSLRKIWEQNSRYGYGNIQSEFDAENMLRLYRACKQHGFLKVLYWHIVRYKIFSNLMKIIKYFFLFAFGSKKPTYRVLLMDSFLGFLEKTALLYGQLKSLRHNRKELARRTGLQ